MADLASDIAASRDRITKLLQRDSSGISDINDALSAVATRRASFGEAMNAVKANRIREEMGLATLLQREQAAADASEDRASQRELMRELAAMRDKTSRDVAAMRASSGGDAAAPVKNYKRRQELVEQYGEGSPEVSVFDSYVRAPIQSNTGDQIVITNPVRPGTPLKTLPKGLPPQDDPKVRGDQRAAIEAAEAAQKKKDAFPKAQSALSQLERKVKTVTDSVDEALGLAENGTLSTGYGHLLTSALPESDARSLDNALATIKANIGFDELQKMRDASPTGGALGAVSEFENKLLQAVQGALDPRHSKQLSKNLKIIKENYPKVMEDRRRAFAADYKDLIPGAASATSSTGDLSPEEAAELERLRGSQK